MKVCFISLNADSLLIDDKEKYVGGAEVQQYILAEYLVSQGIQVEFITYGEFKGKLRNDRGIWVNKVISRNSSSQVPDFVKFTQLLIAIFNIKTDFFYYEAGAEGVATLLCRIRRKPIIYYLPSDANVNRSSKFEEWSWLMKVRNDFDIYFSNCVICQSEYQRTCLNNYYRRDGHVIKNGFVIDTSINVGKKSPPFILWVSNINEVKQPEIVLRLAQKLPHINFIMIGGRGQSQEYYDVIKNQASKLSNMHFLGYISFRSIQRYYNEASIFINTSRFEGFPNSFLQSWIGCTPVVTLNVDPDEIICHKQLGKHSKTEDQMAEDIVTLLKDEKLRSSLGMNGRKYVEAEHNINTIGGQIIKIFKSYIK